MYSGLVKDQAQAFLKAMRDRQIIRVEITASGSGDDGSIDDMIFFDADDVEMDIDYTDPLSDKAEALFFNLCDCNFDNEGGKYALTIDTQNPGQEFVYEEWENETVQHYSGKQTL